MYRVQLVVLVRPGVGRKAKPKPWYEFGAHSLVFRTFNYISLSLILEFPFQSISTDKNRNHEDVGVLRAIISGAERNPSANFVYSRKLT